MNDLITTPKIDAEAVGNLSTILRDQVITSHDELQIMAKEILMFSVTLFGQSTLFMHIRLLEFGLLQFTQKIDKLFNSLQCAMQGKLSIELVSPFVFQNILRNASLHLPEGYELVAGTNINNIHLYYEINSVSTSKHLRHFLRFKHSITVCRPPRYPVQSYYLACSCNF